MSRPDLARLAGQLKGSVVLPDQDGFAGLRKPVLGRLAEAIPQAVVRCAVPHDVARAVAFARAHRLRFAIRSGGHSFADFCATDGLLIDLTELNTVEIEADQVTVGPGVRLGDLAERLADHGRMVPCGWCPTVAVAGSVLGGGYGMLGRAYGLGCDHLLAAQVLLADGRLVWTDARREPDLFWALRGAGAAGFGVVTGLVLRTHPVPPVATFTHQWPWELACRVVDAWQRWAPRADQRVNAELVLSTPVLPQAPPRVVLFGAVAGADAVSARPLLDGLFHRLGTGEVLAELTELSPAVASRRHSYAGLPVSTIAEPGPPRQLRPRLRAVKSEFFDRPLPVPAIEALLANLIAGHTRGEYRELEFVPWGGALASVAPAATGFVHRNPQFMIGHHGIVGYGATDRQRVAALDWARRSWRTVHPWGSGAVYPNYPDPDLAGWAHAYYGANLPRLRQIRQRYDPAGLTGHPHAVPLPGG